MNLLLVDDEELQLVRLENAVRKALPEAAKILCCANPVKALEEAACETFDIAFLDIEMPVINGIQLAKSLKRINPQLNIIFVTAYNDYAPDAYRLHASGYLSKPVDAAKVKEEVENLRYPVAFSGGEKLKIKCFGNFEIFFEGTPVKFQYSKSKELFAYLVDREGAAVNLNELNAVLWEEDHSSYLRNLIVDIHQTLKAIGCEDVFFKRRNECFIDVDRVDCDAYAYKQNDPDAVRAYRGEYMMQYSWPIFES